MCTVVDRVPALGALGTDVLRHCVLSFAHGRAALMCTAPPAASPGGAQ